MIGIENWPGLVKTRELLVLSKQLLQQIEERGSHRMCPADELHAPTSSVPPGRSASNSNRFGSNQSA